MFKQGWKAEKPEEVLLETSHKMMAIVDLEENAWHEINELVTT
jgi:hypothetical protein